VRGPAIGLQRRAEHGGGMRVRFEGGQHGHGNDRWGSGWAVAACRVLGSIDDQIGGMAAVGAIAPLRDEIVC
jgi:hypothetical protein